MNKSKLFILVVILVLLVSCSINQKNNSGTTKSKEQVDINPNEILTFKSGGPNHISGYGEWIFSVDGRGKAKITHNKSGQIKKYGTIQLLQKENQKIWNLINKANVRGIVESPRAGLPDEVTYTFQFTVLTPPSGTNIKPAFVIWIDDAEQDENITKLVNYIGELIQKYTKVKPVLR